MSVNWPRMDVLQHTAGGDAVYGAEEDRMERRREVGGEDGSGAEGGGGGGERDQEVDGSESVMIQAIRAIRFMERPVHPRLQLGAMNWDISGQRNPVRCPTPYPGRGAVPETTILTSRSPGYSFYDSESSESSESLRSSSESDTHHQSQQQLLFTNWPLYSLFTPRSPRPGAIPHSPAYSPLSTNRNPIVVVHELERSTDPIEFWGASRFAARGANEPSVSNWWQSEWRHWSSSLNSEDDASQRRLRVMESSTYSDRFQGAAADGGVERAVARWLLRSVVQGLILVLQIAVALAVLSVFVGLKVGQLTDAEPSHWIWIWKGASPALTLILILCFGTLVIHEVCWLSAVILLYIQTTILFLTTITAVVLCAVLVNQESLLVKGALAGCVLFICGIAAVGFLRAVVVWRIEDLDGMDGDDEETTQRLMRESMRGYGTAAHTR